METVNQGMIEYGKGGMCFSGEAGMNVFQFTVLASALRFYAKTGMKVNAAYTPSAMKAAAERFTGLKFKARDYLGMADALENAAKVNRSKCVIVNN